jgi:hypothetical protein
MACGCPVIAANSSSLPEVAGDAALFFAPYDSFELARLARCLITVPAIRRELIVKGFERVKRFSWDAAAQETLKVYRKVEASLGLQPLQTRPNEQLRMKQTSVWIPQRGNFFPVQRSALSRKNSITGPLRIGKK